jgi:hypothetical protein
LRAQIAEARHAVQHQIEELEREEGEEANRNELRVPVRTARQFLETRINEARNLLLPHAASVETLGEFLLWIERTLHTLDNVFATNWSKRHFEERVGLADLTTATEDSVLWRCTGAVEFLRMISEELYLLSQQAVAAPSSSTGQKVFIGHGRSLVWLELKDFTEGRLHLAVDEFNRAPAAGLFTGERIEAMLNDARFALLVMTGEDEQLDGKVRARENVVHEAGLFQGRLGFKRAIILLEEGCDAFSNIDGLTVIKFPKGKIGAAFEDIRRTLERETIIPS